MRVMNDAPVPPLDRSAVSIRAVQFVGTNVEMTWWVEAPDAEAEPRLRALLESKLGLFAATRTGTENDGRARFSVMASPLDRLFHAIGPSVALTVIKHASVTMDLSDTLLARQGAGLTTLYPGAAAAGDGDGDAAEPWRPWDVGKLLGTLLRRPDLARAGGVEVAAVPVPTDGFPHELLPVADRCAAQHDGALPVLLPDPVRTRLAG